MATFALDLLEAGIDGPAAAGDLDQFFKWDADRGIRQVVGALLITTTMTAGQDTLDETAPRLPLEIRPLIQTGLLVPAPQLRVAQVLAASSLAKVETVLRDQGLAKP